ncbi:polyhydroxyalkanoate granule-associated phasin [Collimonas antrihumi]|uniref:polyhydroxyalkanoate granule-associated phasin n=1 Tax=Collimonas antrihumi TaxID=1940615 RepID=UPI001B8CDB1E|nr:polyhydroxyalkanoate granule-associated phasin [Collimonas antrihumi]
MKSCNNLATGPTPLNDWTDLLFKAGEMMSASAQVIGHRTAQMALAGPAPSQLDRNEFNLMSQEKMEAAAESVHAMAIRIMSLHQETASLAIQHMLDSATNLMSVASSSTLHQSGHRQSKLAHDTIRNSAEAVSQFNTSLANIAQTGLHPIHARATANAKRLKKL